MTITMTAATAAKTLRISKDEFYSRASLEKGFPKPISAPGEKRRWDAADIQEYARKEMETN